MATTRYLTVMFTDIKGFTARTATSSRDDLVNLLEKHEALVLPVLEARNGQLIKTIGDAFLLTFDSPTDAVLAGMQVQETLAEYNADIDKDQRIEVRIAINAGEVTVLKGDVFGDVVNVAARIEGLADAGEIFFTEAVYLTMNRQEVPSCEVGFRKLKGVPEPVRVYKVLDERLPGDPAESGRADAATGSSAASAETDAGQARAGGFWRRFFALCADLVVFSLVLTPILGLVVDSGELFEAQLSSAAGSITADLAPIDETLEFSNILRVNDRWRLTADNSPHMLEIADGEFFLDGKKVGADSPGGDGDPVIGLQLKLRIAPGLAFKMAIWILYSTLFLIFFGATPGKRVLKLRVVRGDGSGEWPNLPAAIIRSSSFFFSLILSLGCLWSLVDKEGRALHDILAKTRVIRAMDDDA